MANKDFEIIVADTAGFCMGVRRAVKMALQATDDPAFSGPIKTHGPLIHNRQVLQVLESRGVTELDTENEDSEGTVVIRAHGLPRERQEELKTGECRLLDATCPHVSRLQKLAGRYAERGYMVVLVGDSGHAEVEGALSFAGEHGHVVGGADEVDDLPDADKVAVMAQTTQDEDVFAETVERIEERYGDCEAFDTICRSTGRRQAEVRDLAGQVDAMVIVGGFHSANTRRLAEISAACGMPTFHVETDKQLDLDAILQYETVGLTAGASTPSWMIRKVIRRLQAEHQRRTRLFRYALGTLGRLLVNTNLWTAGAAGMLVLAAAAALGISNRVWPSALIAFLFVLSQQLFNQYSRRGALYLTDPGKADLFMLHGRSMLALGVVASAGALVLAGALGLPVLVLVALGTLGGLVYHGFRTSANMPLGVRSPSQLRGSKEIFVGLAWATLCVLVPALAGNALTARPLSAGALSLVAFLLAFERTLALGCRAVRADQIVGRETLAGLLGERGARSVFLAATAVASALVLFGWAWGGFTHFAPALATIVIGMGMVCLKLLRKGEMEDEWSEVRADLPFYLAGLAALAWFAMAG
jgi:4-hydroxy-3-methylbut-2-enyl diphosphate reductase